MRAGKSWIVREVFLENPTARLYGYELMRHTGLASGTLYPILKRMQAEGQLTADWEVSEGERPRRYYELTGEGLRIALLEQAERTS